jgi:hypothetical protein
VHAFARGVIDANRPAAAFQIVWMPAFITL